MSPYCIFAPSSAAEVANALSILRAMNTPFAVRGNGHNPNLGFNSIDNGVLIVLTNLQGVTLSPDMGSVSFGAGCNWGSVYGNLSSKGLVVPGGRYAPVGE